MSSDSPMTREDLMPGADFTADAEVAEHAFQRARVGIQIGFAERLAI
jgi:hypothetical protein